MRWQLTSWSIVVLGLAAVGPKDVCSQTAVPDSVRHAAIRELLVAQGTADLMLMGMQMAMADQQVDPSLPAGFMDSVSAYAERDIGQFTERLVPIFAQVFTHDEVLALLTFYRSPLGRRLLEAQPQLQRAVAEEAEQWGMELAARVLLDLSRSRRR